MSRFWTCTKCSTRSARVKQKCPSCGMLDTSYHQRRLRRQLRNPVFALWYVVARARLRWGRR